MTVRFTGKRRGPIPNPLGPVTCFYDSHDQRQEEQEHTKQTASIVFRPPKAKN